MRDAVSLSPRLASPRLASPRLAAPGLAAPRLAWPRRAAPRRGARALLLAPARAAADTFIVFGEATMDDSAARAQQLAAQQFGPDGAMNMEKIQELQKQMEALQAQSKAAAGGAEGGEAAAAGEAGEADAEGDDGEVDMSGLDEKDVSLVMEQGKVSKAKAAKVLKANDGDVVNAIMELTM